MNAAAGMITVMTMGTTHAHDHHGHDHDHHHHGMTMITASRMVSRAMSTGPTAAIKTSSSAERSKAVSKAGIQRKTRRIRNIEPPAILTLDPRTARRLVRSRMTKFALFHP